MTYTFSDREKSIIEAYGLSLEQVGNQLDRFEEGSFYYRLDRPCTIDDGIVSVPEKERQCLIDLYEREEAKGRILKFVPASGAASRMFKDWHLALDKHELDRDAAEKIMEALPRYAFYDDLEKAAALNGYSLSDLLRDRKVRTVLDLILNPEGLNYSNLPKALLKFHAYPDGNRTALEEHLVEGSLYAREEHGICAIHFTVSKEHQVLIEKHIDQVRNIYEKKYSVNYQIGFSIQLPSTDTIAVDKNDQIFRDDSGLPVFRPGGHGALIENLNVLSADIVLIKNIDNVVPDHLKSMTVLYKKILGGLLLKLQKQSFRYLELLEGGTPDQDLILEIVAFCKRDLNIILPDSFNLLSPEDKRSLLYNRLNRPLRVCGMVRNEGEPGGGPFWVQEEDGSQSLQIIESAQVDFRSEAQKMKWQNAEYFNPVDLACSVRDHKGQPFDLHQFIDYRACIITNKSQDGRELKALELPGLWNGSMAHWNTVFMKVPIETFNPVKTVEDLLREQHQGG